MGYGIKFSMIYNTIDLVIHVPGGSILLLRRVMHLQRSLSPVKKPAFYLSPG